MKRKHPRPRQPSPLVFPWTTCDCACGRRVAVAFAAGVSWIPEVGDPGTAHPDVEPCRHCHCLTLKAGGRTLAECRAVRRFSPDLADAQRRRN
jgi:hypothetical protein